MKTIIIAAVDRRLGIGKQGNLLVRLKADMRHFRELTTGHTVVMGRKTFESLPKGALPDRTNIVVTRNRDFSADNVIVVSSLDDALQEALQREENEVYIIGGGQVYRQAMEIADELDLTELDLEDNEADTFFPAVDSGKWMLESISQPIAENGIVFRFARYVRKW